MMSSININAYRYHQGNLMIVITNIILMIIVNIMLMNALMMSTININAYRYHQITNIRNDHDQHLDDYQSLSLSLRELERSLP